MSSNGGDTWKTINRGLANPVAYALAIDPTTPSTLYAASFDGIYKSTNGGSRWKYMGGLPNEAICFAIHPSEPNTIYAGTYGGLSKSIDGGKSWTSINGLEFATIEAIAIDPSDPSVVFAATYDDGLLRSSDGGKTWSLAFGAGLVAYDVAIDPLTPTNLFRNRFRGLSKPRRRQ